METLRRGSVSTLISPTLARLSFMVPPARMAEFEAAYQAKVVPILRKHGLVESSERGQATPDSIFSRLFELKTPAEVEEKRNVINGDATYNTVMWDLGRTFGTNGLDGTIRRLFAIYTAPAGPGKVIPAGRERGHWRTYDALDGLAVGTVWSIFQDREGNLWFGVWPGGVSRYDGKTFTSFTAREGLASNNVWRVFQDREEVFWVGCAGGLSRYDGKTFTTLTTRGGLAHNTVTSIFQDREGVLWFGTLGGVSRYDGKTRSTGSGQAWTSFTTKEGLAGNWVRSILQDREGNLWFGTGGGVSRYDGQKFTTFTTRDGLVNNFVWSILQDREGNLWVSTRQGGVSRYDPSASLRTGGKTWTTFTTKDGLGDNFVGSILQDRKGHLWFKTGGSVSRYDGQVFQTLTRQDGLPKWPFPILQDREGNLWFGDKGGVTRYRPPNPVPSPVFIDAVLADRRHERISELAVSSNVKLIAFEFHAMSFKTRPEAMVYRYRLNGYDKDWKITHERRVEYPDLPRGIYTFEVQAVDRDLVYSEKPATVVLRVHAPYVLIGLWWR